MGRYLYIILLMCFCQVEAQTFTGKEFFTWLGSETSDYELRPFQLAEQVSIDEKSQLPVKLVQCSLPYYIDADELEIQYSLETTQVNNDHQLNYLNSVSTDGYDMIKKHVVCIRGQYYLHMEIIPLVFDEFEKNYHLINEFDYTVVLPEKKSEGFLKNAENVKSNSVLGSGKWVKIRINESGVHRIPYSLLTSWGFSKPQSVNVFGNGGNLLPRPNAELRHEDLVENSVIHEGDAIYFYAQGPTAWNYNVQSDMFEHQKHDYTDVAYYFLSDSNGEGKRVQESEYVSETFTYETSEFDSYTFHEFDNQNLLKSGLEWYGLRFDPGQTRNYLFEFNNRVLNKEVKIYTNLIARSDVNSNFRTHVEEKEVQEIKIQKIDYSNTVGAFANEGKAWSVFNASNNDVSVDLTYESSSGGATGWLNFLCLNAKCLINIDKQLQFRNSDVTGEGNSTRFYLDGVNSSTRLWDITDHTSPQNIVIEDYSGQKGFTYKTDNLKEFIAFDLTADIPQPEFEETLANQDIRGISVPEMLIIAHPLFESEANRLAEIHKEHSGLHCEIVFPYQIYNEFSSGSPDITAIRDYARYLYKKDAKFKCLLLFGDGSYDNRTYDDDNTNKILTYQSYNSIDIKKCYVSDDYYGFLDDNEGQNILFDKLDIGIGRFPVNTIDEATIMVDKVEKYLNESSAGAWKTDITFLADDGDSNLHMRQANDLSTQVYGDYPAYNHNKIFFDAYPKVTTSSGDRYPEVNEAIKKTINDGTLLFNYTGHGSERQLADENVLDITTIKSFTNIDKLPVFVTATCEFSRYDDYHDISAGEWVVLSPLGAGVALFTTTRIAWSHENFVINKSFYKNIFREDEQGNKVRLGEVIKNTKNDIGGSVNKLNFTLLGDPSLQLAYPQGNIQTKSINGEEDPAVRTEMKALTLAEVEGEIKDADASGAVVTMQVFDKPITVKTLGNKGAVPFEYQVYQNKIYQGQMEIAGNQFLASFIIPKDIRYNVGQGRISYYAYGEDGVESFGADNSVLIGGVSDNPPDDTQGPDISIWLNDSSFENGDITGSQPILYAKLSDESGINTSGVGIGHDITLVVDGNRTRPINLNAYYTSDLNSYTSGMLSYQLPQLTEGKHALELKVWDNLNNSSMAALDFEVRQSGGLQISEAKVYPNPVETNEVVNISFKHDAPNAVLDVTYSIYSMNGRLIEQHETTQVSIGTSIAPVEWTPSSSLQRGLYVLHCEIKTSDNQVGKFSKKILVVK
ncbi:type IX secretion system sortase PorU [Carboxylicivirga sp. RSCT41]|uniref:type IX secretion system sortase PorU n=1 Tax=Carboxylicivirga agarovorans TaxID=3417570 RepID=UPI003D337891